MDDVLINIYVCVCTYICLCKHIPLDVWVLGEATEVHDPLESELQEIVGVGTQAWVLWKIGSALRH